MTLEAFADTVIPGCKRYPEDRAIAGVSTTPGAVDAGALLVLQDPATGIEDGVGDMADLLDQHAQDVASERGLVVAVDGTAFADLDYPSRRELVASLTAPGATLRDFWFLLALFSYMAFDSAPHLDTAMALAEDHPGLLAIGFARPDDNGVWEFDPATYGRPMATLHPATDENGNLP
ncbi:DUF5987 family protein [Aeromicrobium sp. CF3.5]|uniref:DUF5987 family protein n=1 Tax=Aeromicrobium sp. CF3.5 TaxID=3373078 RepID=UPI003EE6FB9D